MAIPAAVAFVAFALVGVVIKELLNPKPTDNVTKWPEEKDNNKRPIRDEDPKKKDPPTLPVTPPTPKPTEPPRRVFDDPFPRLPERYIPPEIDLRQREHRVSNAIKETLSRRKYGCMLHEPVQEELTVVVCQNADYFWGEDVWGAIQEEGIKAFFGWLFDVPSILPEKRETDKRLAKFNQDWGIGLFDIDELLTDKICQLAFVGISLYTRGSFNKLVSQEMFVWGCSGLTALLAHWTQRNNPTIQNFPLIFNSYLRVQEVDCDTPQLTLPVGLGDAIDWAGQGALTQLLIPDPGEFDFTEGKLMQIYWMFEDDPQNKHAALTQLHHPKQALWDCFTEDGTVDEEKQAALAVNWDIYFSEAVLYRTLGYVKALCYAKNRPHPIASGFFIDKDDARQYFTALMQLTDMVPREKNNPVFVNSEEEDLFDDPDTEDGEDTAPIPKPKNAKRVIKNAGRKLIVRKVVIAERKADAHDPKTLVEYFANRVRAADAD